MKFRVPFKTPYALDQALADKAHCEVHEEYDPDCTACLDERFEREHQIKTCAEKFIEYDEYVTIEFDTEAGTATVVPLKGR